MKLFDVKWIKVYKWIWNPLNCRKVVDRLSITRWSNTRAQRCRNTSLLACSKCHFPPTSAVVNSLLDLRRFARHFKKLFAKVRPLSMKLWPKCWCTQHSVSYAVDNFRRLDLDHLTSNLTPFIMVLPSWCSPHPRVWNKGLMSNELLSWELTRRVSTLMSAKMSQHLLAGMFQLPFSSHECRGELVTCS